MTATRVPQAEPMRKDLAELVTHVQKRSPYYQNLWENVTISSRTELHELPVTNHTSYWAANTCTDSQVVTDTHVNGVVLKTGGTTGHPKFTFYTRDELRMASQQLGEGIISAGVRCHDRIANLFYAGEMYGSFLLHVLSIMDLSMPLVHLPIGGFCSSETTIQYMRQNSATIIFATPTTMIKLAEWLTERCETMADIRVLMFSGEAFYSDQEKRIRQAFPNAQVRSLVYGSIDAGALGYSISDTDSRLHKVAEPYIILEICPDGSTPTTSNGISGVVLVTNLGRRLQPVIRYPSGDRAEWVDFEKKTFRVLGRHGTAVRVGPVSIDIVHLQQIARSALQSVEPETSEIGAFQAVITRRCGKDALVLRLGCLPRDTDSARQAVTAALVKDRPMWGEEVKRGHIAPLEVEFLKMEEFSINPTTGKLVPLVDERPTE